MKQSRSRKLGFVRMTKLVKTIFVASITTLACISACFADTFTHRRTGEVLHGYATSQAQEGLALVQTQEKGLAKLNLAEWQITTDRQGRNNRVSVFDLDDEIGLEIETAAFEKAIVEAADEGPLFILLEIDTPGGRKFLANRLCGVIMETKNCPVIAFVKVGTYGGAISAGAAVALACDKIYMASATSIGAATTIIIDEKGIRDLKQAFGETVAEKFDSAWQAKLASLAEQNGRPGLLAKAMIDKDIEVIEVSDAGRRLFIEPINKKPQQKLVHTWSQKGSLLTLTAAEAVQCMIADKVAESRDDVLRDLDAASAEIVENRDMQDARAELKRADGQVKRIRTSIDLKMKESEGRMPVPKALKILREAELECKTLITLAKKYPDLEMEVQPLEEWLNTIKAASTEIKRESRRR